MAVKDQMTIDFEQKRIYYTEENGDVNEHKPISTSFQEIEVLRSGKVLIVEDGRHFDRRCKSNLYCLNQHAQIEWYLPLPDTPDRENDTYVGFTSKGTNIFANTWSGFQVEINIETGEMKSVELTK